MVQENNPQGNNRKPKGFGKIKNLLLWILTGFLGLSALVYLPSFASLFVLLAAVLTAPISKWQTFLRKYVNGTIRTIVIVVLVVLFVCTLPATDNSGDVATPTETTEATETIPSTGDTEATSTQETVETTSPTEMTTESNTSPTTEPPTTPTTPTTLPATEPTSAPTEPPAPTDPPATTEPPTRSTEPEETEPVGTTYVLNTNSNKFHLPSCSSVDQMSDENKEYYTGSREEVINMGYKPCKNCNP